MLVLINSRLYFVFLSSPTSHGGVWYLANITSFSCCSINVFVIKEIGLIIICLIMEYKRRNLMNNVDASSSSVSFPQTPPRSQRFSLLRAAQSGRRDKPWERSCRKPTPPFVPHRSLCNMSDLSGH